MVTRKLSLDIKIDKFNLEEELAKQPDIFYYWAKKAAGAKEERDQSKNTLKKLESTTLVKIWTGKYPLPINEKEKKPIKLTGDIAKALVAADDDVCVATDDLSLAEAAYAKASAAEEALQQKRSSLKHLTELYVNEYYSQTGANTSVKVTKTDQKSKDIRKKLNKK